jgi:hypothetical protein
MHLYVYKYDVLIKYRNNTDSSHKDNRVPLFYAY